MINDLASMRIASEETNSRIQVLRLQLRLAELEARRIDSIIRAMGRLGITEIRSGSEVSTPESAIVP